MTSFAELAEWDWAVTLGGDRLHGIASLEGADVWEREGHQPAMAFCGLRTLFTIPGIFTRMGAERCSRCCDKLGWPRGTGSPKNDPTLRPLVEARLAGATS